MDADAIKVFLTGLWQQAQWHLLGIGALSLVLLVVFRRPGKAFVVLLLGVYVIGTTHFLSFRESMGFTLETALGVVVLLGLAVMALLYYFIFIRTG